MVLKMEEPFLWNKQAINCVHVPAISHLPPLAAADPQSKGILILILKEGGWEGLGYGSVVPGTSVSAGVPFTKHTLGTEFKLWLHF